MGDTKYTPRFQHGPGAEVSTEILECWVELLNACEKDTCNGKKRRLFFGPYAFGDWLWKTRKNNEDVHKAKFANLVNTAVAQVEEEKDLHNFSMIVFAVFESKHYYTLVFNLDHCTVLLIENIDPSETVVTTQDSDAFKKKDIRYKIKKIVGDYLTKWNHPKASMVQDARIKRLELSWATSGNVKDCRIFTMRHMEVFNGDDLENWKCGFATTNDLLKQQISSLRIKYAARLLLSSIKVKKDAVLEDASPKTDA